MAARKPVATKKKRAPKAKLTGVFYEDRGANYNQGWKAILTQETPMGKRVAYYLIPGCTAATPEAEAREKAKLVRWDW
jgi:hypothetical protein